MSLLFTVLKADSCIFVLGPNHFLRRCCEVLPPPRAHHSFPDLLLAGALSVRDEKTLPDFLGDVRIGNVGVGRARSNFRSQW